MNDNNKAVRLKAKLSSSLLFSVCSDLKSKINLKTFLTGTAFAI